MQPASKARTARLLRMQEPIDFPSAFRRAGIGSAKFRGEVRWRGGGCRERPMTDGVDFLRVRSVVSAGVG